MRILIVTNNYTPYSGGVVSSLNALIPALQQAGHEVLLVAPQLLAVHADDPTWVQRVPALVRFPWHNNRMAVPWRMKHFLSIVMREFKPDVVHVQHPFLLGAAALNVARSCGTCSCGVGACGTCAQGARVKNVPVVFTYHTMYEAYAHYVPLPRRLVQWFILRSVKHFCNAVDTVIVPGNAVQKLLRDRGMTTPIVVIPSPLQEIFLQARERNKQSDNRLVLLTVGRFVPEKNMAAVLDLYAQIPCERFRLVLIGYGTLYESLQEYAYTKLGLSRDDVQFVHKPPQAVIAQWYVDADFFIFTSHTDTQGLVLVEAMAGGLPVLALSGPGQQEVVRDGVNGFICESIGDMRNKLLQFADAPEQRALLRVGARTTAQKYRPEVLAQQVISVYEKLAS